MSDRDLDAEFARIIAGWDDEAPDPQPRRPHPAPTPTQDELSAPAPDGGDPGGAPSVVGGDDAVTRPPATQPPTGRQVPETSGAPGAPAPPAATGSPAAPPPTGDLGLPIAPTTSHSWRGSTARDDNQDADDTFEDDEHFVPPSEIDLPSAENDPMFWAIVGGLGGGPLLLLYLLFFDRDGSGWWVVTALAMIVVGFVLLVLRGGTERDPFDDGTRL